MGQAWKVYWFLGRKPKLYGIIFYVVTGEKPDPKEYMSFC